MSKTAETYVLPKVPSQLIRIALEDIEKAEQVPNLKIEMDDAWHWPDDEGKCVICFAGAVIRERLGVPDDVGVVPGYSDGCDLPPGNNCQLRALNDLRLGMVRLGFSDLGIEFPVRGLAPRRNVTPYRKNRGAFKADMRKLADDLEAAGH